MTQRRNKVSLIGCAVVALLGGAAYGLRHGYFDHGRFDIKQSEWSSTHRAAMLIERSDEAALSSYTYFVLIGDHQFSPSEIRHAFYGDAVVYSAQSECSTVHWRGANSLVIACHGSTVEPRYIEVQKRQMGDVSISYENIPT